MEGFLKKKKIMRAKDISLLRSCPRDSLKMFKNFFTDFELYHKLKKIFCNCAKEMKLYSGNKTERKKGYISYRTHLVKSLYS